MKLRGISIFGQTLLLLFGSVIATQLLSIALILALPPARPDFIRMSEIAEAISGRPQERHWRGKRVEPLVTTAQAKAPVSSSTLKQDVALTADLARRSGVEGAQVRLFFVPDQSGFFPFFRAEPGEVVPMRRGEALFFNTVIAGFDTGKGWRVFQSPPRPVLSEWQRRSILLLAVNFVLLLAFAWFFARQLSLPIRRFAVAADRMGADVNAPPVPVEGPVELRTTAQALNGMQARIGDYLRERTAMIGAIAHDLRTPLARIAFRIENAPDPIREPVQNDIEQMRAMIAATMDFVKGTTRPKERQTVDIASVLSAIVTREVEVGHTVTSPTAPRAIVTGDAMSLERLFQNLIDNAVSFGGSADVAMGTADGMIEINVSDRGPGLPDDQLEAVFDPFVRVDPSRSRETGGVGLGLTITRMIAEDHGGSVRLHNREGGGLVATVFLPVA
jgi:two-component system, OmpR family, sensor kinase